MRRVVWVLLGVLLLTGCATRTRVGLDFTAEQKGRDLVITVTTPNFQVPRDGHIHIQLDDLPQTMAYASVYTVPNVKPGRHKVTVELSDVNHNYLGLIQTKQIDIR